MLDTTPSSVSSQEEKKKDKHVALTAPPRITPVWCDFTSSIQHKTGWGKLECIKTRHKYFIWQASKKTTGGCFCYCGGYPVTQSRQVGAGKSHLSLRCKGTVYTTETETILLSSHLKSSKMVWCSPLSFWTRHELYPQPKFVCCPDCMRCSDARSDHLPWAHSLNGIARLVSFLTMSPGKAHTLFLFTCCKCITQYRKPCDTHTHTTPSTSNQGHQVAGLGFGGWWVIFWSMSALLSSPTLPRGNEGMISPLSSTRHSQRKQTGTFYGLFVDLQPRSNNGLLVVFTSGWAT